MSACLIHYTEAVPRRRLLRLAGCLLLAGLALPVVAGTVLAQGREPLSSVDPYNIGGTRTVSLRPALQTWRPSGLDPFTEYSARLRLRYRFSRNANLALQTNPGQVSGLEPSLQGFTDTQAAFSYRFFRPDVALNVGLNLPTGRRELSQAAFETSTVVANSIFGFHLPTFGQGLNANVSFVWAKALSDALVLGLGAGYEVRTTYEPVAGVRYDPGDELMLTAGLDYRLNEVTALDGNVIVRLHGKDRLDDQDFLTVGNRYTVHLKLTRYLGFHTFSVWAYVRHQQKNEAAAAFPLVDAAQRNPNGAELHGELRLRASPKLVIRLQGEGRLYGSTTLAFSKARLVGLGIQPEWTMAPGVTLPFVLRAQGGSVFHRPSDERIGLFGLEVGAGIQASF